MQQNAKMARRQTGWPRSWSMLLFRTSLMFKPLRPTTGPSLPDQGDLWKT